MKKISKLLPVLLTIATIVSLIACAGAENKQKQAQGQESKKKVEGYSRTEKLKITFGKLGNDNEFDNQRPFAHYLMEKVEEYSNGMITFDFFPNGQLGSESDMLDQVISGDLDVATLSEGTFMSVTPEVSLTMMPFLFDNSDEFMGVAGLESKSKFQKELMEAVDNYGLFKFIGTSDGLFRALSNSKHEVKNLADLKNINMRIQPGEIYTDTYAALGASTATIAFGELFTSLQQGAVDGEDCALPFYYNSKFYEVEGYTTDLRMFFLTINCIVSNKCWNNKFTEEDREVFMKAAAEAQKLGMKDQAKMDEEVFDVIEKVGAKLTRYTDISEESIKEMKDAVKPVWEKHSKINKNLWNILQDDLATYRKKVNDENTISE